jgi:hypothetical protein
MSKITNRDELKLWVHRRLGAPVVKTADLHDTQLDDIIDYALDRFYEQAIEFSQTERILYLPTTAGESQYDISDVTPQPTAVIRVMGDRDTNVWTNLNVLFTVENMMIHKWGFYSQSPDMLTFQVMYDWMDFFQTMYGRQYRVEIWEHAQQAYVLPPPKYDGFILTAVYAKRPEEELYKYSWIRDYVFAKCLVQIGMNRGKYAGIALPGGGTLNADMYLNKGEEMIAKLDEQLLLEWSTPPGFEVG